MKTTKRKRSPSTAKTQPGAETSAVDAVGVAMPDVAVASAPEAVAEMTDTAVEALVAPTTEVAADIAPVVVASLDMKIVLAANCSVKDAAALKTTLCAVAKQSADVTLDVSAVERIDTATMQLLCAFARDRSGRKQGVTWIGVSPAVQDAASLLGVRALLGFETAKGIAA